MVIGLLHNMKVKCDLLHRKHYFPWCKKWSLHFLFLNSLRHTIWHYNKLNWNNRIDSIGKKASKKLYSLRLLLRAGVAQDHILEVYLSTVRPVLEYSISVWQAILDYLFHVIKAVQKRGLWGSFILTLSRTWRPCK